MILWWVFAGIGLVGKQRERERVFFFFIGEKPDG